MSNSTSDTEAPASTAAPAPSSAPTPATDTANDTATVTATATAATTAVTAAAIPSDTTPAAATIPSTSSSSSASGSSGSGSSSPSSVTSGSSGIGSNSLSGGSRSSVSSSSHRHSRHSSSSPSEEWTTVNIGARSVHSITLPISEPSTKILWKFLLVKGPDIGFDAVFQPFNEDAELDEEVDGEEPETKSSSNTADGSTTKSTTPSSFTSAAAAASSSSTNTSAEDAEIAAAKRDLKSQAKANAKANAAAASAAAMSLAAPHRATAQKLPNEGGWLAPGVGTVTVNFDNSYSLLTSKTVSFSITLHAPGGDRIPLGLTKATPFGPAVIESYRPSDGIYSCRLPYGRAYFPLSSLAGYPNIGASATSLNERAMVGVNLFFNNQVKESEAFFAAEVYKYPIFAAAYAAIGFLRALMTWEKADIDEAHKRLKRCRLLVANRLPSENPLKTVGRFFTGGSAPKLSALELENSLISAESSLLTALLLLTDESLTSWIRAGLQIRSGWKTYERCYTQTNIEKQTGSAGAWYQLDRSTQGGIEFGVGTFNLIISLLPQTILRLVAALGFPSDRGLGIQLLHSALSSFGMRGPLASLNLLFYHVVVPSFFSIRVNYHLQSAAPLFDQVFHHFPNGSLFLWMYGRYQRLNRDLPAAISSFQKSADGQPSWLQLQHLCSYELGFAHLFLFQYEEARVYWRRLAKENSWSPAFFNWVIVATLFEQLQLNAEAKNINPGSVGSSASSYTSLFDVAAISAEIQSLLGAVEELTKRKFGGKTLSIEVWVLHRTRQFLSSGRVPLFPVLELIFLFYGFVQMSTAALSQALQHLDDRWKIHQRHSAEKRIPPLTVEDAAFYSLIRASILKAQGKPEEAQTVLKSQIIDVLLTPIPNQEKTVSDDSYVLPFAMFESAAASLETVMNRTRATAAAAGNSRASLSSTGTRTSSASISEDLPPRLDSVSEKLCEDAALMLKRANGYSKPFHFKNRIHFRLHLANTELQWLTKGKRRASTVVGQ